MWNNWDCLQWVKSFSGPGPPRWWTIQSPTPLQRSSLPDCPTFRRAVFRLLLAVGVVVWTVSLTLTLHKLGLKHSLWTECKSSSRKLAAHTNPMSLARCTLHRYRPCFRPFFFFFFFFFYKLQAMPIIQVNFYFLVHADRGTGRFAAVLFCQHSTSSLASFHNFQIMIG